MYTWASDKSYFYIKLFVVYTQGGVIAVVSLLKIIVVVYLKYLPRFLMPCLISYFDRTVQCHLIVNDDVVENGACLPRKWSLSRQTCPIHSFSAWKGPSYIFGKQPNKKRNGFSHREPGPCLVKQHDSKLYWISSAAKDRVAERSIAHRRAVKCISLDEFVLGVL